MRNGWLQPGKWVVIGRHSGRIKKLWRSGEATELKLAGPNEAVEITGLGDLHASAGQALFQAESAQQASKLAAMAERLELVGTQESPTCSRVAREFIGPLSLSLTDGPSAFLSQTDTSVAYLQSSRGEAPVQPLRIVTVVRWSVVLRLRPTVRTILFN